MRKPITTSNYDFEYLIQNDLFYADKTDFLYQIVCGASTTYFLSRPRRFGKSLMLSTLKCILQGKRDLFKGLKIDGLTYHWKAYPVIHLNMSDLDCSTTKLFKKGLLLQLHDIADDIGVKLSSINTAGYLFRELMRKAAKLSEHGKVALLIDEYDKPLVDNIEKPHLEEIRQILGNFYQQIKNADSMLRFTFMTGVTKFSKVSVFSNLNHLTDLTMNADFATALGYTDEEVDDYFGDHIIELADSKKVDYEEFRERIRKFYNGYRFEENAKTVYNPVSLGNFLNENGKFSNFWFDTGSPSWLMNMLKKKDTDVFEIISEPVDSFSFSEFDAMNMDARALLFQTGYLTIKEPIWKNGFLFYRLGFPNGEVEQSFTTYLTASLVESSAPAVSGKIFRLMQYVEEGKTAQIVAVFQALLANIPYDKVQMSEASFRNIIITILHLMDIFISVERHTNLGRIDTVIYGKNHIYIIEYKFNKTAEEAMKQIHDKKYYDSYLADGKPIHLLDVNYNTELRNIGDADWQEEIIG